MNGLQKSMTMGYVLAISGGIFWAVGGSCGQYLFQHNQMTSNWLVPIRLTMAGILLLLFSLVRRQNIFTVWQDKRNIADLLLFGLLGSALCQYAYYTSIQYSNVALATVLAYMSPVMILLYTVITEKRLPRFYETISVLLVIAGTFTCTTHLNLGALVINPLALFWGLVSAASFVIYTMQPRRLLRSFDLLVIIGWGMLIGGIALLLLFRPWNISVIVNPALYLHMAMVIIPGTVTLILLLSGRCQHCGQRYRQYFVLGRTGGLYDHLGAVFKRTADRIGLCRLSSDFKLHSHHRLWQ